MKIYVRIKPNKELPNKHLHGTIQQVRSFYTNHVDTHYTSWPLDAVELKHTLHCRCKANANQVFGKVFTSFQCPDCGQNMFVVYEYDDADPEHGQYEFQLLTKETWTPPDCQIHIRDEVINLIKRALNQCEISYPGIRYKYGYTDIRISPSDPTRISGVKLNKIQSQVFDREWHRTYKLDLFYTRCLSKEFDDSYMIEHGTYLKLGKLVRGLMPTLSESAVTCVASALSGLLKGRQEELFGMFQVTDTPSEIYTDHRGYDFTSCMQGNDWEFFELYDMLPNVSLVYAFEDNRLRCRALLHSDVHIDDKPDTIKFMDRIYCNDHELLSCLQAWARQNGYHQDIGSKLISPAGEPVENDELWYEVPANLKLDKVPYMDTFCYYDVDGKLSSLKGDTCLQNQEGHDDEFIITQEQYTCDWCSERTSDPHCPGDLTLCESCYEDSCTCEDCGDVHHQDDSNWLENYDKSVCNDCLRHNYTRCEECGGYVKDSEKREVDDRDLCENCSEGANACKDCDDLTFNTMGDEPMCRSCASFYDFCPECETYHKDGDTHECN